MNKDLWIWLLAGLWIVVLLAIIFYHVINVPACHRRGGIMLNFECVNITLNAPKVPL